MEPPSLPRSDQQAFSEDSVSEGAAAAPVYPKIALPRETDRPQATVLAVSVVFGGTIGMTAFSILGLPGGAGFLVGFGLSFLFLASAVLIGRSDAGQGVDAQKEAEIELPSGDVAATTARAASLLAGRRGSGRTATRPSYSLREVELLHRMTLDRAHEFDELLVSLMTYFEAAPQPQSPEEVAVEEQVRLVEALKRLRRQSRSTSSK